MHRIARVALIGWCMAAMAAAAPACPAESTPREAAQPVDDRKTEAPVTLDREAVTLEELLVELGDQADLKLAARPEVRWDQVTLRVRCRPAGRVMAELAELLNYNWERERRGQRTVYQDVRSRVYDGELRRRWFADAVDELLNYGALANRPPQYYLRLRQALRGKEPPDPRLQGVAMDVLTSSGSHAAVRLLLTLSREQLLALVNAGGQGYYLPWREMSPAQRELALLVVDEMARTSYTTFRSAPEARRWLHEMGLLLDVWLWPGTPHPHTYGVHIGDALLDCGYWITPRPAPPQGPVETRGNPYPPPDARPRRTAVVQGREAVQDREYEDLQKMPFPARGFGQSYPSTWPEVFRQLADRLPFALYSDYFPARPVGVDPSFYVAHTEGPENPPTLPLERMSLEEGLNAVCARYGKIWWRNGDALFFRSRIWFLERLFQVPPLALSALQQQFKAHGKLDRQGVGRLAGLTQWQLSGIHLLAEEELKTGMGVPWSGGEYGAYRFLRVYAMLTDEQKGRVLAEGGLPFSQMTGAQQRAYREALFLSRTAAERLEDPPPFHLEQAVIPGIPGRKPSLGELAFFLVDEASRREKPRSWWPQLAGLYIPFPAEEPEAEAMKRRR